MSYILRAVFVWVMLITAIVLGAMLADSEAREFSLLRPDEVYINYHYFVSSVRDPMLYPDKAKEALNLVINTDIFHIGFFNTKVLSKTTDSQYKYVALDLTLGIRISSGIELFYNHLSQHLLEGTQPYLNGYPVQDSVGINLFIFRDNRSKPSIF